MLDGRLTKSASQVRIVAGIGFRPRNAGKLLIINGVTNHFHGSPLTGNPLLSDCLYRGMHERPILDRVRMRM
jgi:hypothetical protein